MSLQAIQSRGKWIATSLGHGWSLFDPQPEDVYLQDILVGLSRVSRYAGQVDILFENYSVAEHSALMTKWMLAQGQFDYLEDAIAVLLHDASEAYYGDMVTPLKREMPFFRRIEDKAQDVIFDAFDLSWNDLSISKEEMKEVDIRIRIDERLTLIREPSKSAGVQFGFDEGDHHVPLGVHVQGLGFKESMRFYMGTMVECCSILKPRNEGFSKTLTEKISEFNELCVLDFSAENFQILDALALKEPEENMDMAL